MCFVVGLPRIYGVLLLLPVPVIVAFRVCECVCYQQFIASSEHFPGYDFILDILVHIESLDYRTDYFPGYDLIKYGTSFRGEERPKFESSTIQRQCISGWAAVACFRQYLAGAE